MLPKLALRAQMSDVTELGQARARAIIQDKHNSNVCEIDPFTSCWLFTGSRNTDGYGQVSLVPS